MAMCNDVKYLSSRIEVVGKVERKEEIRTVNTKFGETKVCNAYLADETGEVRLTLWDSDVERIQNGYTISIQNGYARVFRGEKYLQVFRGSIHIISTNSDYGKCTCKCHQKIPETHSKISTKNYNPSPSEDTPFLIISEKDQDIPHPDLGEIAKIERQYWRESLA